MNVVLLLLLLVCAMQAVAHNTSNTTVNFLLMVAGGSPDSSAVVSAVDQTLEEINRDTSILPGCSLEYILRDTLCNKSKALNSYFDVITSNIKPLVAVVGCGCSAVTEEIAKISPYFNMTVISYASTSVVLSDRSVYRSFFRTVPSNELLPDAVATVMNYYKWEQLLVFSEEQPQYLQFYQQLWKTFWKKPSQHITISYIFVSGQFQNYSTIFTNESAFLFNKEPHIFLINTGRKMAVQVLCSAYHTGKVHPNYAWILLGHHETDWWREHYMETNCSDTDMMKVLNRSLVFIPYPDIGDFNNFMKTKNELHNTPAYASDAVRALAAALHSCFKTSAKSQNINCRGIELNWNVHFTGSTGVVKLDQFNGNRVAKTSIIQQHQFTDDGGIVTTIGLLQMSKENGCIFTNTIELSSMWPDGIPPDGTPVTAITLRSYAFFIFQFTLPGITLICITVCFIFTIAFRKRKIVKLTSPTMSYMLLFGVLLLSIAPLQYPSTNIIFHIIRCMIDYIFSSLGYDIIIAVALLKTLRVYYIFKKPSPNKKMIKDWHLLIMTLFIATMDMILLVPILIPDVVSGNIIGQEGTGESKINSQEVTEHLVVNRCDDTIYLTIFIALTLAYKFLLHVIALVMAFLIRKVHIDVLNDSRETRTLIYILSISIVVYFAVHYALYDYRSLVEIAWATVIFMASMTVLGLMFVPKMIALHKDPKGLNVFKRIEVTTVAPTKQGSSCVTKETITSYNEQRL